MRYAVLCMGRDRHPLESRESGWRLWSEFRFWEFGALGASRVPVNRCKSRIRF